ncbi:MAG: hypothetical protein IJX05_05150 [Clostridia bacterium]|nr:hypothetical protein [Clostridia bacterium]
MYNFYNSFNNDENYGNNTTNNSMGSMNNSMNNPNYSVENNVANFDTLQKARKDLIGEIQAVIDYDAHLHSTTDKLAKETWANIMHEEMTHVGELLALISYLDQSQKQYVQNGINEFLDRMK